MNTVRIFPFKYTSFLFLVFFGIIILSISSQAAPMENEELVRSLSDSDIEKVQVLLDQGIDVNLQDVSGWTALILASMRGDEALVKFLLKNRANPNLQRNDGWTALILASALGHGKVVKLLLENSAEVNLSSFGGYTALMSASESGHDTVVKLLLDNGADVNRQLKDGWTALFSALSAQGAVSGQHEKVVKILLENGADVNAKYLPLPLPPHGDGVERKVLDYAYTDNMRNMLIAAGAR